MEKELPNKFRSKANRYYYLAEMSTQANAYNISITDENGKGVKNLNKHILKEEVQEHVKSGHWKIVEEYVELPKKFSFTAFGTPGYTAEEQDDSSFVVWFENRFKYEYSRDIVEKYVKRGDWVIQKEKATEEKPEPTLLDDIKEFVELTNSEVNTLKGGKFNVFSPFLDTEFNVKSESDLKTAMAAITTLWDIVHGK